MDILRIQELLEDGLENKIASKYEKHLKELATYYECFDLCFKVDDLISKSKNFETYIFNNNDAKRLEKEGKNRFEHLISAFK